MKILTRLLISLGLAHGATAAIHPTAPRCEYHSNPTAIGTITPRFSCQIVPADPQARHVTQNAYEIEVTREDGSPLWASGKVSSSATDQIQYAGEPLASRDRANWRVRVWDGGGNESPWSETATFAVGLLEQRDWSAQWISMADNLTFSTSENVQDFVGDPRRGTLHLTPAKYFRKEFEGPAVPRTTVHATALGGYKLEINGQPLAGRTGVISSEANRATLGSGTYQLEIT